MEESLQQHPVVLCFINQNTDSESQVIQCKKENYWSKYCKHQFTVSNPMQVYII